MKYRLLIILYLLLCGCDNNIKQRSEDNSCKSRFILFVYLGENSKYTPPLLLRTNEMDTTYLQYVGESIEMLEKNGFLISEFADRQSMYKILIDNSIYNIMENYIEKHNTNKDLNYWTANSSTIKIILADSCNNQFISYAINNLDTGYFDNLIKTVNYKNNENLRSRLEYYKAIQMSK